MQLHNGALHFVTEMGQGTTFRLVLPLANTPETKNAEIAAHR
jgi:signal transduction histidine kinase